MSRSSSSRTTAFRRHPWRWALKVAPVLEAAAFLGFFAFVVVSNDFDWDHFLTTAEVDARSWWEGVAPRWSYQLCGGVTRQGDPQALGLSPLFAWVMAFGSFWGLKTAWVALAFLGHGAMQRLLRLFFTQGSTTRRLAAADQALIRTLSLGFVLGNFFLWHAHHGHFTFALDYLALWLVERALSGWAAPLSWRQTGAVVAMSALLFSSGVYQPLVFLLLPLGLALLSALPFIAVARRRASGWSGGSLSGLGVVTVASLGGVALAFPRLWAIVRYQAEQPRVVGENVGLDGANLLETLISQFVPTLNYRFAGVIDRLGVWGIWETSAFSITNWVGLIAVGWWVVKRPRPSSHGPMTRPLLVLLGALVLVTWGFTVGEKWSFSLFELLNVVMHHSVRVAGRYQLLGSLLLACTAALSLGRHRALRRGLGRTLLVATPLIICADFFTFTPTLRLESLRQRPDEAPFAAMQTLTLVGPRTGQGLPMYTQVLAHRAVLNCYDPIARETRVAREKTGRPELLDASGALRAGLVLPLVDPTAGTPPSDCFEGSTFTQSQVRLHASCRSGTCVNLNSLNPDDTSGLVLQPESGKYCLP